MYYLNLFRWLFFVILLKYLLFSIVGSIKPIYGADLRYWLLKDVLERFTVEYLRASSYF